MEVVKVLLLLTGLCGLGLCLDEEQVITTLINMVHHAKFHRFKDCDVFTIGDFQVGRHWPTLKLDEVEVISQEVQKVAFKSKCAILLAKASKAEDLEDFSKILTNITSSAMILVGQSILPFKSRMYENKKPTLMVTIDSMTLATASKLTLATFCAPVTTTFEEFKTEEYVELYYWPFRTDLDPWEKCGHPLAMRFTNISYNGIPPFTSLIPGDTSGTSLSMMKLLAERFSIKENFIYRSLGKEEEGMYQRLSRGEFVFACGTRAIRRPAIDFAHMSPYIFYTEVIYASRPPIPLSFFSNLTRLFPVSAWAALIGSLLAFAISLALVYSVYAYALPDEGLVRKDSTAWFEFILIATVRWLEPEEVGWFPKWSTGRLLILNYYIFTTFISFFVLSTFRSTLISQTYEKPMTTNDDAVNRGLGVYINVEGIEMDHTMTDLPDGILKSISIQAHDTENGRFSLAAHGLKIPDYVYDAAFEDGSVIVLAYYTLLYDYLRNKTRGLPNLQYTRPSAMIYYFIIGYEKFVPWAADFDSTAGRIRDMGFHDKFVSDPIPIEAMQRWSPPPNDVLVPLGIPYFELTFLVCGFIIALSFCSLLMEMVVGCCNKSRSEHYI